MTEFAHMMTTAVTEHKTDYVLFLAATTIRHSAEGSNKQKPYVLDKRI